MLGGMLVATMVTWFGLTSDDSGLYALGADPADAGRRSWRSAPCSTRRSSSSPTGACATRPRLAPLITAIGMSFILQNVGLVWKGARPTSVESILPRGDDLHDRRRRLHLGQADRAAVHRAGPASLLIWLVQRTRQGKAMRATAQDRDAAAMMGINVNRTISFTFLIAGGLAGSAGSALRALHHEHPLRRGLPARPDRVHRGRRRRHRQPPGRRARRAPDRMIESFNNGLSWATPGQRLDEVDHLQRS